MKILTRKPPWRMLLTRVSIILCIGLSLNFWIDACSTHRVHLRSFHTEDPILHTASQQSTSVICQEFGKVKQVWIIERHTEKRTHESGRIALQEVVDTTFIGTVAKDEACEKAYHPWIENVVKKGAMAHH